MNLDEYMAMNISHILDYAKFRTDVDKEMIINSLEGILDHYNRVSGKNVK